MRDCGRLMLRIDSALIAEAFAVGRRLSVSGGNMAFARDPIQADLPV